MPFAWIFATFTRERDAHIREALELGRAYKGTARLLAEVLEEASGYTGEHSRDVVASAVAVADELKLDADARQEVEFTALLHDVGKLAMPREIISKPGPLSDDEWALIRTHTIEGERLLGQVGGVLGRVGRAVRSSHERWDGRGYPDGLAGEDIPLAARIVSCCDALDAMTSDRPYRSALPARGSGRRAAGRAAESQFDPEITEVAARIAEQRSDSPSTRRDAEEIAAVAEATRELAQATDREEAHKAISRAALKLSGAQAAVLLEPDADGNPSDASGCHERAARLDWRHLRALRARGPKRRAAGRACGRLAGLARRGAARGAGGACACWPPRRRSRSSAPTSWPGCAPPSGRTSSRAC